MGRYKWEILAWLWLAYFFNQADRQIFNVVLSLIQADLSLTDAQVGLIATLFTLAFGLTVPFAGLIGDALSRKWACTASIIGWSLATIATGFSSTLSQFILFRSLATGGGEAVYAPSNYALIADYHRASLSLAMAIHQSSNYLGIIASGAIAGWMGETWGWRSPFIVFGVCGVVVGIGMALRLRDYRGEEKPVLVATTAPARRTPGRSEALTRLKAAVGHAFRTPTVLLLALAFGGFVYVSIGYLTWMPTLMRERYGLSLAAAGFLSMAASYLPALVGVVIAGRVSDRLAPRLAGARLWIQVAGLVLMTPFITLMGLAPSVELACVGLAGFGFFRGLYDANIMASLYEVTPPAFRATASSVLIGFAFMIGAAAPFVLGLLRPRIGLEGGIASLAIGGLVAGAAIIVALILTFHRDRVSDEPVPA